MHRGLKIGGIFLLAILLAVQFIQPEQNREAIDPEADMLLLTAPPEHIESLIRNACYDCHSNQTAYPWYAKISPVSWYLRKHIHEGKEELNLSNFGRLEKADKIGVLADICEVLDAGSMPLRSYLLLHKNASIDKEEKNILCDWTEMEALKVMRD